MTQDTPTPATVSSSNNLNKANPAGTNTATPVVSNPAPLRTNPSMRTTHGIGTTSGFSSSPSPVLHRENSSHVRRLSSSSSFSFNPSSPSSRRTSLISGFPIHASHGEHSSVGSPGFAPGSVGSEVGVGVGPGPQRYPKPRTAADLHFEMEQEQEAVVNRLTRELLRVHNQTALNQQSSSTTSTAAADEPPTPASARTQDPAAPPYFIYGSSHPRHHRTASATSSAHATAGNLSRQGSMRSIRSINTGGRNTPPVGETPITFHSSASALSPGLIPAGYGFPPYAAYAYQQPASASGSELNLPLGDMPGSAPRTGSGVSFAETMQLKKQMEHAQQENEELRQKIKALEKELRELGAVEPEGWGGGSARSTRSRSPSTTRSTHRGRAKETRPPTSAPTEEIANAATTLATVTTVRTTTSTTTMTTKDPKAATMASTGNVPAGVSLLSEAFATADAPKPSGDRVQGGNQKT